MKFCVNCGSQLEDAAVFCTNCGAKQEAPVAAPVAAPVEPTYQPAPVQPVYQPAPVYQAPVEPVFQPAPVYQAPVQQGPSAGTKVLGGIGFGLSMTGFVFALLAFIMGCVGIDDYELASMALGYSIACMPLSILGLCFCGKSRKNGNCIGLTASGKVFGIIGIVLLGLAFILGCAGLA